MVRCRNICGFSLRMRGFVVGYRIVTGLPETLPVSSVSNGCSERIPHSWTAHLPVHTETPEDTASLPNETGRQKPRRTSGDRRCALGIPAVVSHRRSCEG